MKTIYILLVLFFSLFYLYLYTGRKEDKKNDGGTGAGVSGGTGVRASGSADGKNNIQQNR